MKENKYQSDLKKRIAELFPGCMILRNDPRDIQGIPDLLILFQDKWAALEVKKSRKAALEVNQDWYLRKMNGMSFAAIISPETEEEVLHGIQEAFGVGG